MPRNRSRRKAHFNWVKHQLNKIAHRERSSERICLTSCSYQDFLRSNFWKRLAFRCKCRDKFQCVICGSSDRLNAHHTRYPARWIDTTLDMLQTLCRKHHKQAHQ